MARSAASSRSFWAVRLGRGWGAGPLVVFGPTKVASRWGGAGGWRQTKAVLGFQETWNLAVDGFGNFLGFLVKHVILMEMLYLELLSSTNWVLPMVIAAYYW